MAASTSHRVLLGAALAMPVAATVGAAAPADAATPFRLAYNRYIHARAHYENLPVGQERADPAAHQREEAAFLDAVRTLDRTPVQSWAEFAEAFIAACDDGDSDFTEDTMAKLLADVRRLKQEGRTA